MPAQPQPLSDRVADLERQVSELLALVAAGTRNNRGVEPYHVRWARTWGPSSDYGYGGSSRDYPEHDPDCPLMQLPAVFLDGRPPSADDGEDPCSDFIWTPRSAEPQQKLVSPGGWIPEEIELLVGFMPDRRYHVLEVPVLDVVLDEDIDDGDKGLATLWLKEEATDQHFYVWFNWMTGGNPTAFEGQEARVYLKIPQRKWAIDNKEC